MIIVKSTPAFEPESRPALDEAVFAAMATFHEELAHAGELLDASGLQPSRTGWRVHYDRDGRRVVDGPFAESKELIAGYTLLPTRSREEALQWSRRFPNPVGEGREAVVEVRQLFELEDFEPTASLQRLRALQLPSQDLKEAT
jgi:hypothetical protein